MRAFLLGLLLLLLSPLLRAEALPVITLDQGQITVLRDKSKQLTLDQARAAHAEGQFKPLAGNLGLGYIPDAVWLRLSITQEHPAARWLEVMPPYLDDIRLFHIRPDGQIDERRAGDRLPQSAKEENYRGNLFKLAWQPGEHEIYLRLQSTSTMAAIVKLWQPDRFERHLRLGYFAYGLYFSLILTVLLFNTVNWLISRRRIFLVYVGYLFLNALQWLGINGFVAEFIFPAQPLLANLTLGMSLSLAAAMAFGFFIMVLELKQHHPVVYRISLAGMALCLVTALATPFGYYGVFAPWMLGFGVLTLCSVPWPALRLWRMGDTSNLWARLLAIAYLIYGVLIAINILGVLAVLPFSETINLAGMSSNIAHILLLHFAILLHYRRIEADHAGALEKSALAIRQADLEKSYRQEQDKLLAMITHEIRTPIAVIDAATQTLEALDDIPSADREERYDRIHRSVNRLSVLLDLATAQTRSEIADWQLTQGRIEPAALTDEVIKLLGNPLAQRIQVTAVEALPTLIGDDRMLRFALLNLLDNACKYSSPESPVRVHIEAAGGSVTWRVEDNGPGILPGMEEKIFEKYVRLGESGNKAGLGLGLYLARHIVARHGGTLTVETGRTKGACFICCLPATNKKAQP
ncbi:MAG: sensor histidine kinase [Rhodocyclaceae bacterium]|nr:sensor histidine kinase [Rhodocyclaceae bacterium]MDZ4216528.1 sensor histidine kinase [Rhodocyclaceae bacterium]